jgi:hypothetical protein
METLQAKYSDEGIKKAGCYLLALARAVELESGRPFASEELEEVVKVARITMISKPWKPSPLPIIGPGRVGVDPGAMILNFPDEYLAELVSLASCPASPRFALRQIGQQETGKASEFWQWVKEADRVPEYVLRCFFTVHGGTHFKLLDGASKIVLFDSSPECNLEGIKKSVFYKVYRG